MDAATAVAIVTPIAMLAVALVLVFRWGMGAKDDETAAVKSQLEQAANQHEAERQRDAAIVAQKTAEGNLAVALADNAQLHDSITKLLTENLAATKAKVDAASGSDLVAAARAVMGLPNPSGTTAGAASSAATGGGAAPAASVSVPRSATTS